MSKPTIPITREQAAERARAAVAVVLKAKGGGILLESGVVERPTLFAFRWSTRRHQESRDRRDAPVGATHVVVDRRDGTATLLDAHGLLDTALDRWERRHVPTGPDGG